MRLVIAAIVICTCSTPLLAEELILRCDSPKQALSFSVLIDPAQKLVLEMGFASKVETERFSDTVISATNKEAASNQNLIIDRVTGQFQLTWASSGEGNTGGQYGGTCTPGSTGGQYGGTCTPGRRLF